ncbi:MAG: enoyl-CoA hydratase/isomerase family protein [Chloroflexi bacterium]|nr:enoyl-CoA hydratase/isomerase family protein [Chloroflexota bacterium]
MDYETVKFERQGRIAIITLNRPQALNAFNTQEEWDLSHAFDEFEADDDLWVAIIKGEGRCFSAGADVKEMSRGVTPEDRKKRDQLHASGKTAGDYPFTKPIIAAVHGYCLGAGLITALQCDMVVAAEDAQFGVAEVKRGLPPTNVLVRVFRSLPYKVAMDMNVTGDNITAQDAYRWGAVNQVVPREQLMEAALKMANRVLDAAPLAQRAAKKKARLQDGIPLQQAINIDVGGHVRQSEDLKEGIRAFVEKRKPVWRAR